MKLTLTHTDAEVIIRNNYALPSNVAIEITPLNPVIKPLYDVDAPSYVAPKPELSIDEKINCIRRIIDQVHAYVVPTTKYNKIETIKMLRNLVPGLGLKEAKDEVEGMFSSLPVNLVRNWDLTGEDDGKI